MLTVRTSFSSPFGRKARIAVGVLGLDSKVKAEPAATQDPADPVRQQNPLGKVPVLILDDGRAIFDSPVILEYLDHRAGGAKIIPSEPNARYAALTLQSLCDGVLDACLLQVYEGRWRPAEKHEKKWLDYQAEKVKRAFDVLEAAPPALGAIPDVGVITLACALGYGDLRFAGTWRKDYPKLVAWLDAFAAKVPAFEKTRVTA